MKLTSNIEHRTSNIQRPVRQPHWMLDVGCWMFDVSPSVTRRTEQGIALVITLILLSVTLVMAVAFLAIANRERNAVTTTTDTATARHGAETALAYAEAQIVANILSSTNAAAYNFSLLVSTNYINGLGFTTGSGNPTNVNYDYLVSGGPLTTASQRNQNIANLWFLPRAPVFITTNRVTGGADFRYYLDLNRNGRFETNGFTADFDSASPPNVLGSSFKVGDPEWIGILERPDAPHGPDNKFVARVAFVAQPIGNSLDINAIHNNARRSNGGSDDGFLRNQGVGSWELNLGAFLADLNTNQWFANPANGASYYDYEPTYISGPISQYRAFDDALALLNYRYGGNYSFLTSANNSLANVFNYPFNIDGYSDGPLQTTLNTNANYPPGDVTTRPWSGADNTNRFFALSSDLFDPNKTATGISPVAIAAGNYFTGRLLNAGNSASTYDRYTFYRMLDQLGTDSTADSGKMDLNYDNLDPFVHVVSGVTVTNPPAATNLLAWTPLTFFTNAADRMLRTYTANWFASNPTNYLATYYGIIPNTSVAPNGYGLTNVPFSGMTNQVPAFGISSIPVQVNGSFVYSPAVNRLLQLAANIYDASTNSFYPSVFRPVFEHDNFGNVFVVGYRTISNGSVPNTVSGAGDLQLAQPYPVTQLPVSVSYTPIVDGKGYVNVYGVPWIIGAKKGFPNFNQLSMANSAQVTRKLMLSRNNTNADSTTIYKTNQMYVMSITNNLGISFWNSYSNDYPRPLTVYASDRMQMTLTNNGVNPSVSNVNFIIPSVTINAWPGSHWGADRTLPPNQTPNPGSFYFTNWTFTFKPESIYRLSTGWLMPDSDSQPWETNQPLWGLDHKGSLGLMTTNYLQAFILDGNQVVDYVQLRGPIDNANLNQVLADPIYPDETQKRYQWSTNLYQAPDPMPYGVYNQIEVSEHPGDAPGNSWIRPPGMPSSLYSSTPGLAESAFFNGFFLPYFQFPIGSGPLYTNSQLSVQAPYTPTRMAYDYVLWQANDPLVHYLGSDLNYQDPGITGWHQNDASLPVTSQNSPGKRYQPWGATKSKQMAGLANTDPNPYNLADRDPLIWSPENWDFPTNQYPTVGWIGRVHRGTPWQTVYLKATNILNYAVSGVSGLTTWVNWSGDANSFDAANAGPTQDRLLFDVFTTSFNDNAARGTLSVNVGAGNPSSSAGLAAWSALFSGMVALSNSVSDIRLSFLPAATTSWIINPAGVDVANSVVGKIVSNIYNTRTNTSLFPLAAFTHVGDILSVPSLTEQSPFLKTYTNGIADTAQLNNGISDEVYEWLPQQMMSLLRCPMGPHYVIYCYGQTLKPAPGGLVTSSSNFKLVTNYQVVAESAVRAVIRVDKHVTATGTNYSTVVESYNPLPPN